MLTLANLSNHISIYFEHWKARINRTILDTWNSFLTCKPVFCRPAIYPRHGRSYYCHESTIFWGNYCENILTFPGEKKEGKIRFRRNIKRVWQPPFGSLGLTISLTLFPLLFSHEADVKPERIVKATKLQCSQIVRKSRKQAKRK